MPGLYRNDNTQFSWEEQHLYGSSRLGMIRPGLDIPDGEPLASDLYVEAGDVAANGITGKRLYELSNHLGIACPVEERGTGDHQRPENRCR